MGIYDLTSPVLYAAVDVTGSNTVTIVPAVPGRRIRVLRYTLVSSGTAAVRWSDTVTEYLTGSIRLVAGQVLIGSPAEFGHFQTTLEIDGLDLEVTGVGVQVGGDVTYQLV